MTDPPRGELRPDPAPTDAEPPPAAVLDPSLSSSAPPASPTAEPEASAPLFGGPSTSSGRRARRGGASARGGSFEHGGGWWPLALGVPLITAGGLMAGFGISALVINGQCVGSGACDRAYDTKLAGGLLLGLGLPLAAGGAVVIALRSRLSGSRHAVLQRVAAAPVAGGLR